MKLHIFSSLVLPAALLAAALSGGEGYCLRAENGRLAAFDAGSGAPVCVYETPVSSLRRADRALVENGLYFGTYSELTRACEDFCS